MPSRVEFGSTEGISIVLGGRSDGAASEEKDARLAADVEEVAVAVRVVVAGGRETDEWSAPTLTFTPIIGSAPTLLADMMVVNANFFRRSSAADIDA